MDAGLSTHTPVMDFDVPVCGDFIAGTVAAMTAPSAMQSIGPGNRKGAGGGCAAPAPISMTDRASFRRHQR